MRKQVKGTLAKLSLVIAGSVLMSGCATICAHRMQSLHLFNTPKDLVIKVDGKEVSKETPASQKSDEPYYKEDVFGASANYATGDVTAYYVQSLWVKGFKEHVITFHSDAMGKTDTVRVKPKFNFRWVFGNLFSFGVPGMIVDGITGKWKNLRPNYLDVHAILAGTTSESKGKLKRHAKRTARRE